MIRSDLQIDILPFVRPAQGREQAHTTMSDLFINRVDPAARQIWRSARARADGADGDCGVGRGEEFLAFRLGEGGYSVPARRVPQFGSDNVTRRQHTGRMIGLVNVRGH